MTTHQKQIETVPVKDRSRWLTATGIGLIALVLFVLSHPARIDVVDGQYRYDTAQALLHTGKPAIIDPALKRLRIGSPHGRDGKQYSFYGIGGSLTAIPLLYVADFFNDSNEDLHRFLFATTGAFFGALTLAVLYLFYRDLGVSSRRAVLWTLAIGTTTLVWTTATTTFDNIQHTGLVIVSVWLAYKSAECNRRMTSWALVFAAGLMGGLLIDFQEYLGIILPFLAFATLRWPAQPLSANKPEWPQTIPGLGLYIAYWAKTVYKYWSGVVRHLVTTKDGRQAVGRYLIFGSAASVGLMIFLGYNWWRFGSIFESGRAAAAAAGHPPVLGNPLTGFMGLFFSPGKSIFLFSPPIILCILAVRRFCRQNPVLGLMLGSTTFVLVGFLCNVLFFGGDWCWGPRYLTLLLPLWALTLPNLVLHYRPRLIVGILLSLGFFVQLLGLSMENFRFFYDRDLTAFFWSEDPWYYFRESQLFSRPFEVMAARPEPVQKEFAPGPYPGTTTYCIMPGKDYAPDWRIMGMNTYQVFRSLRPWPFWESAIEPNRRPLPLTPAITLLSVIAALGLGFLYLGKAPARKRTRTDEQVTLSSPTLSPGT
jgi:hypothetical protein